jgi:hypothetical protein
LTKDSSRIKDLAWIKAPHGHPHDTHILQRISKGNPQDIHEDIHWKSIGYPLEYPQGIHEDIHGSME